MIANHTFEPVYNENSKILILGSMPSMKSRENRFYYSNPQNRFWDILATIFEVEKPQTVAEKANLVIENNLALWDVLKTCEIIGSADNTIKNPVVNDINSIINQSKIEFIYTTGKTATNLYNKYCLVDTKIESKYLPSSSPANAKFGLKELVEAYKIIKL